LFRHVEQLVLDLSFTSPDNSIISGSSCLLFDREANKILEICHKILNLQKRSLKGRGKIYNDQCRKIKKVTYNYILLVLKSKCVNIVPQILKFKKKENQAPQVSFFF